jgi:hypothetical protein
VIEVAYKKEHNAKQQIRTYDWTSLYNDPEYKDEELQIIHLHGYAPGLLNRTSKLIFSILEYLQATSSKHAWHRIFGDQYLQKPFIVVGARLSDEFDLADVIRRGNCSKDFSGRPSFIILKTIPDYQKERFKKWGLTPLEMKAEDFFNAIKPRVDEREKQILEFSRGISKESMTFFNQFKWLRISDAQHTYGKHDFYLGDDPDWSDILSNKDAIFEKIEYVLKDIDSRYLNNKPVTQMIYCLSGPPGSGKSTSSLRLARELILKNFNVFYYRGESRLDCDSAKWCLKNFPKSVLIFDGMADFSEEIGRLASDCNMYGLNLLVVGTEREQRLQFIYQEIDSSYLKANEVKLDKLSDTDIRRLIAKLEDERRLGKITRYSTQQRLEYFKKYSRRQLLVGMSELEGGIGFHRRIRSEYDSIKDDKLKSIYKLTCITYSLGYQLPLPIACTATGADSISILNLIKTRSDLSGVLNLDDMGLKPRHRVIASLIVEKALSNEERFDSTLILAKVLSPYVTRRTISERTLPYRIVRRLMDEQLISDWVGPRAREWYESLSPFFSWNARYWEQRALLESRMGHFPRARSYAEEAIRIQRHSFSLNTLGSILTKMSLEYFTPGSTESMDIFWEGIKHLRDSRDSRDSREDESIHPYTTFFTRAIHLARTGFVEKGKPLDDRLKQEWANWITASKRSTVFSHPANFKILEDFQKAWLSLAVNTSH